MAILVFLITITIGSEMASVLPDATNNSQRDVEAVVGILSFIIPVLLSWLTYRLIKGKEGIENKIEGK